MKTAGSLLFVSLVAGQAMADITVLTDRLAREGQAGPMVTRESFESEEIGECMGPRLFDSGLFVSTSGADVYTAVDNESNPMNTFHLVYTTL